MKKFCFFTLYLLLVVMNLAAIPTSFSTLFIENNYAKLQVENLTCTDYNVEILVENEYVEVTIKQRLLNESNIEEFHLGLYHEEQREKNIRTISINGKEEFPIKYFGDGQKYWDTFSLYVKKDECVNLEIKTRLLNLDIESESDVFNNVYFYLDFLEPAFSFYKATNYCVIKNNTIDRILYFPGNIMEAREMECVSGNCVKFILYEFPYFSDDLKINIIDYKINSAVSLKDVISAKKYFLKFPFFTQKQLRFFRNSIYAKHGRSFKDSELLLYFRKFNCYKINENFAEEDLTEEEIELVKEIILVEKNLKEMYFSLP